LNAALAVLALAAVIRRLGGADLNLLYRRKDSNLQILEYECNALAEPSTN
jgi:hypothetical protein